MLLYLTPFTFGLSRNTVFRWPFVSNGMMSDCATTTTHKVIRISKKTHPPFFSGYKKSFTLPQGKKVQLQLYFVVETHAFFLLSICYFRYTWHCWGGLKENCNASLKYFLSVLGRLKYLTLTDPTKVWMPDTFFRNEKEARKHEIIVPNVYVRIFPDGEILYSIR